MSVYHLPVTSSGTARTDLQEWKLLRQLLVGTAERYWLAGICVWPKETGHVPGFWNGTVPAGVTSTTFTDSAASGVWKGGTDDVSGNSYLIPWEGVIDTGQTYAGPTAWELIIDDNDPDKVIRTAIKSWTNAGKLTFVDIGDAVTSAQIPSIASLVGKSYRIIGNGKLSWAERLLQWPNDEQLIQGTVASLAQVTNSAGAIVFPASPGSNCIRLPNAGASNLAGMDILFYSGTAEASLHRATISSNTAEVFFYSPTATANVGSAFSIVHPTRRCYPGRDPTYAFAWYRGAKDSYFSRNPEDNTLGFADMPAYTVPVPGDTGGGVCGDIPVKCFDTVETGMGIGGDVWTDYIPFPDPGACPQPSDENYTPLIWRSIRAMQRACELVSYNYVVPTADFSGSQNIPNIGPAEMYRLASDWMVANSIPDPLFYIVVNTGNVTGATGNNGFQNNEIAISGSSIASIPYFPFPSWANVHRSDGSFTPCRGLVTSPTTFLASDGFNFTQQDDGPTPPVPGDSGATMVIAPGYTLYFAKQFKRMFDDGGFIPDLVTDPGTGVTTAQDPAAIANPGMSDDTGVGIYVKKPKSSRYISRILQTGDFTIPQGFAFDDPNTNTGSIKAGDLARYSGDNYFHPTVENGNNSWIKADSLDPLAEYWDGFYVGERKDSIQAALNAQLAGKATAGGTNWLRDDTKNWYQDDRWSGVMRYETMRATAGSTTSVTDSTKTSGDAQYFWENRRFAQLTTNGAYATFPIEIDTGSGTNTDTFNISEARQVTTGDASTGTLHWIGNTSISANGRLCRVHEPYKLNRYQGRTMTLTSPGSSGASVSYKATNTGNAGNILFFNAGTNTVNVTADWTYSIEEPPLGAVYRRDTSNAGWTIASGTDQVRLGVTTPTNFLSDPRANLTDWVTRYGLWMHQAKLDSSLYNQMFAVFNVLTDAKYAAGWDSFGDLNARQGANSFGPDYATAVSQATTNYNNSPNPFNEGGAPLAQSTYTDPNHALQPTGTCSVVQLHRRYAYCVVTGLCTRIATAIDFYCYGDTPLGGPNTGGCGETFNANGDPVAYKTWTRFSGGGGSSGGSASASLGGLAAPAGSFACTNGAHTEGYFVTGQLAIAKGRTGGGLTIIA